MTQPPPPPPHQPPQQPGQQPGFGPPQPPQAPQTPPPAAPPAPVQQPGYGYPQQQPPQAPPQAPPGYGYPQAAPPPQAPPQAPPGYGYPGQAPNPYGQPTPPYGQQPPYGYAQPTMPLQPQAQPGGKKFNAQLAIIVSAVVAIALIVGGGVWYATSSGDSDKKDDTANSSGGTGGKDDGKDGGSGGTGGTDTGGGTTGTSTKPLEKVPANPASKILFQVPAPKVSKDTTISTAGSWLTDKVYAKSGVAEITGYDPDKGTKLWNIKLPGPVCQGSNHATTEGRTAIIYQPAMPTKDKPSHGCSQIAALDLNTGKKLWTKTANSGDEPISFNNITVSGGTAAVGSTSGGAAFDLGTGKQLWAPKPTDTCYDAGYGGGAKLVAVRRCGSYDQPELHIQTIDPKSGKVISDYQMGSGIAYASVVSSDPLVVAADVGESAKDGSGISDFFSIDNKTGKLRTRISAPSDQYAASCDGITKVEECHQVAVGNDRLYISTEEHDGSGKFSQTNEIVALDLATGKQTGQRADAGEDYTIMPLRMDGTNIIAYKRPPYDKGGQIVSIDGSTFKETKLLENPATESVRDAETGFSPDYSELLYSQGHLYMSAIFASDLGSSSDEEEYLALAFGTN
ncbi:PQQ-binding-like beta-propeller repeat protein [Streptomyces lincolnensis]|uniref:outer membrane protein assembly factor BamB family protein n=1 Tax=Streptomyces lincolnensis TaxID=1915 RepID=UPI001E4FEB8C|nr:PQQ-binding-like beta-propeller repeat protein [Streptomyces lincolnensis]MCD7441573.1 PQQ-binding-like beta-propeller repeat protein [Streptomyces lincolnensis]